MSSVPGWPVAFRGSAAVAAGLVSWDRLRGPAFERQFPDVYLRTPERPADLALRSRAAYRYVAGRGVLSGYSAAELLGASCGPADAPAEVTVPGGAQHSRPGLIVHRDALAPGEIHRVGDLRVTTPLRTAYDLARWCTDLTEAVVAVDALSGAGRFRADLLLHFANHYPRARGNSRLPDVLAHSTPFAGSPMESRLRMVIELGGLPRPIVQHVVTDPDRRTAIWLDLAYPEHLIGIEYEGGGHTDPDAVLRDAGRYTRLVAAGWRIFRYTGHDVYHDQARIVAELGAALLR